MMRSLFKLGVPVVALASSLVVANPTYACTTDHQFIGAPPSQKSTLKPDYGDAPIFPE